MSSDFDVETVRRDFPILSRQINGHPLVYLDSSNTSQKPRTVIDTVAEHYAKHNANVARAMHTLGAEATAAFEGARARIADFIAAAEPEEVVFTKNASESLNLAANTLGSRLGPGDEVVISVLEHHSNLVPWQMVCERTGATLRWFDEMCIRDRADPVEALASALNDDGYVTKVDEAPAGAQLCQHHCPVAHVAAEFPQLCEAETQMFSRLLGTRVQRLATIAHGDGVCTTNIPLDIVVIDHEMVIEHTPRERKRAVENHRATDNNREATSA